MEDLREAVGTSIAQARRRKGLSQAELGARVGNLLGRAVKEGQISDWENSRNLPRLDAMVMLAKVLETSIDQLVMGEESFAQSVARRAVEEARKEFEGRIQSLEHEVFPRSRQR